jgi:hypothetical protein
VAIFKAVITLNGVDITANTLGVVKVEAEESVARIARFFMVPTSGAINAGDWLGKAVTINYQTLNSAGSVLTDDRIFTGIVDVAVYDHNNILVDFSCTDDFQNTMESLTQAQIDTLITGSNWSEAVFGEYKDGWQYLENLLDSVPKAYDINKDGAAGTLVDWAAKVTPDYGFDVSSIINNSMSYSLAPRRELYNSTVLTYQYRFGRLKHREHSFGWAVSNGIPFWTFCDVYLVDAHELPTRDMINAAAEGSGWKIQAPISYTKLPDTGLVCGGQAWGITEALRDSLVTGASFTAAKRWTQTATETYTITVDAPQSVAWLGSINFDEGISNSTELDADGWAETGETPTGHRVDAIGDFVIDKHDRAVSDQDIITAISRARTEILAAHRANWVEASILLNPELERFHTVELDGLMANGAELTGKGKVVHLTHEMDIDKGTARTIVRVAVSLNGGAAAGGDSAITPPTAPLSDPVGVAPSNSTSLLTYLGNDDSAPLFDEAWNGFMGNWAVAKGTPSEDQIYPRRFSVTTPDINQDAVDAAEGSTSQTYSFDIPNETLTIVVP